MYAYTPLKEPTLITEQVWPDGTMPLVHSRTMTYNHENYIRECIEGILMQKTTFPVQVLIHDDASTDKTAEIVREYELKYPRLIKVFYQIENSYQQKDKTHTFEMRETFNSWRIGKYEALCEGDDFWTDPLKLQKQMDIFEKFPDTLICGARAKTWKEEHKVFTEIIPGLDKKVVSLTAKEFFYWRDSIRTCTRMVPTQLMRSIPLEYARDYKQVHYLLANNPDLKIRFLDEIVAVYREHPNGLYSGADVYSRNLNSFDSALRISQLYSGNRNLQMERTTFHFARKLLISRRNKPIETFKYFKFFLLIGSKLLLKCILEKGKRTFKMISSK